MSRKGNRKRRYRRQEAIVAMVAILVIALGATVLFSQKDTKTAMDQDNTNPYDRPGPSPTESVITPASDLPVIITEDGNQPTAEKSEGLYHNQRLSVSTGNGMTLTLGMDQPEITDALYLNPHFEYLYAGNPQEAYGYLIRTERVPLEYADENPSQILPGITDYVIIGRTYDQVTPAAAHDSQRYGVRWMDSPAYGGREHDGDRLRILIIRLSDGTLMGAVKADIEYDARNRTYRLSNCTSSDVSVTGELTAAQREYLIAEAVQYLVEGNGQMSLGVSQLELLEQARSMVVEAPGRVYHSRLFDASGNVVSAGKFSNCDVYAVHMNCNGYGFFTVYFAPEPQANGLSSRSFREDRDLNLVLIGYDAFAPFDERTFTGFLHPEDVEKFMTGN